MTATDLITVGEAMIRFSTPSGTLLAEAPAMDVHVAGAESNVAVAVARMGHRARWLSRLTDNVLGRRIVHELTSYGVDCSGVAWTGEDRVGTYFLEFGAMPRPTRVIYDRAFSAASKMTPQTFDPAQLDDARVLHLTGITAPISDSCYALVAQMLDRACERGLHVVLDVNFRARLWTPQECTAKLSPLIEKVSTLIVSQRDAATVFEIRGSAEETLNALHKRFNVPQVAVTVAEAGAVGLIQGAIHVAPGYRVQMVDRIGAGDAFAAGLICGILRDDFVLGLRYGVAMSALQLSLHGDLFRLGEADVIELINSGIADSPLR